jgi:phosphatidate cytidylyltransferase
MKERTISSVIIISVALLAVILSEYIVYPIALALLGIIALFEVLRVVGVNNKPMIAIPAYLFAIAFPVGAYFLTESSAIYFLLAIAGGMFVYLLLLMGVSVFSKGKTSFVCISEAFVAVVYITVSMTSLSLLRYFDRECGVWMVVLAFMIAWATDTFAFATGKLFGKHKLIPEISPKKTIEGSVGGVVVCIIFCFVYGFGLDLIFENITVDYLVLGLCALILSLVSQLGDLIASLLKREHGVKDYGTIFPGHGGIMDRFDSVFAISTILLIVCILFPPFAIK